MHLFRGGISIVIKECISILLENENLTKEQATRCMTEIMTGEASPAQIGSFLVVLRKKGETVEEVTAFARVMREFSRRIHPRVGGLLVDTCGTGGDKIKTFNVSTTSAFVVAAAGIPVAKHGNRSFTSKCGSADLLEQLGLNLDTDPENVERSIDEVGIGFLYAPNFHPAMKNVGPVRREIGVRTVFNLLGPLTNPAGANAQLIGVAAAGLTEPLARVLAELGTFRAFVVHGADGLDEISNTGESRISEVREGVVRTFTVRPEDFGLSRASIRELLSGDREQNAEIIR